eukprot:10113308-Ditylum_brightwellii.AAC.1
MNGGDLSNMAWALARNADGMIETALTAHDSNAVLSNLYSVIRWIGDRSFSLLGRRFPMGGDEDDNSWWDEILISNWASDAINHFQPLQLSRLMWSLSSVMSLVRARGSSDDEKDIYLSQLSRCAIEIAGAELSIFSPEDL